MDPLADLLAPFASAFSQHGRLLSLRLGASELWSTRLLPQYAEIEEQLSGGYTLRIRCLSPQAGLPLKQFVGQPACLGLVTSESESILRCGLVTRARALGGDGGFAAYELQVEAPLALLRHRHGSRIFQACSVPEIIARLVQERRQESPAIAACFELRVELRKSYPARSYCVQYRESELAFMERLLTEEGIAWRYEHIAGNEEDNSVPRVAWVLFDDAGDLPPCIGRQLRFHRTDISEAADGLTVWQGARRLGSGSSALASFDYKPVATSQAGEYGGRQGGEADGIEATLEDYDPQVAYYASDSAELAHYARLRQQAHDRDKKVFHGEGAVRTLQAGRWFELVDHPVLGADPSAPHEFVVTRLNLRVANNLPGLSGALSGEQLSAAAVSSGAPEMPCRVCFEAQRRGIALPPDYRGTAHARPTARGPQTATVVGPAGEVIHTDEYGRIKAQFHWQRERDHANGGAAFDERSSCWLRVSYPSAGAQWGHQFVPRIGQEVLVDFLDGDIDRPVVVGVLGNGSHRPVHFSGRGQLPANKALSGIKSQEMKGSGYNELLFDDTAGQLRTRLSSEHSATQLNLGYLVHPRTEGKAEPRGEGAELRTDAAIALRSAQGMLFSAYGRVAGEEAQLARGELLDLLEQCRQACSSLAEYAERHQALAGDGAPMEMLIDGLKAWDAGSNLDRSGQGGGKPAICVTAPEGLAFATPQNILGYAGLNQDLVATRHLQLTAGEQVGVNAGAGLSLFAQSGDVRAIAHQGQYLMQAQHGDLVAEAERNVRVSATTGEVVVSAPTIRLVAEDGSFIRIGGGITLGTEAAVAIKAARQSMSGPATDAVDLPAFDKAAVDQRFQLFYPHADTAARQAAAERRYEITLKDGRVISGVSDSEGRTELLVADAMQLARIRILDT